MATNEQILDLVKQKGPILPVHVSKQINDNLLMTSARLSELLSNKKLKISSIKVGGSPLYYVDGQESRLQDYADNLGSKEKEAYKLLKEKKVLRDLVLEPAIRVALRMIKDFSIQLQVNYLGKTEIFWKWYLTQHSEAQEIINEALSKKEAIKQGPIETQKDDPAKKYQTSTNVEKQGTIKQETRPIQAIKQDTAKTPLLDKTSKIADKTKEELIKKPRQTTDRNYLLNKTNSFFSRNKINKVDEEEIKKNLEMNFIVELETSIGKAKYFCKSKNRKKISESDLSTAMIQAQSKGLPLIFITTGKISKKAMEMLNTDFKNIIYREI